MSEITTHVLDISIGRPAAGVPVILEIEKTGGGWKELSRGATDGDGRLRHLLAPGSLVDGTYRLTFETAQYFRSRKTEGLYPQVSIVFQSSKVILRRHTRKVTTAISCRPTR